MQTTDRPREIVIHQSANRPNQILGGDRELVLIAMLTAISLAFSLGSWWGIGLSVAFWVGAAAVLQRMGKADPLLRQIYVRHIRYKAFYPAKSGLLSRSVPAPAWMRPPGRNWKSRMMSRKRCSHAARSAASTSANACATRRQLASIDASAAPAR